VREKDTQRRHIESFLRRWQKRLADVSNNNLLLDEEGNMQTQKPELDMKI
jgi:hypothetical protein